MYKLFLTLRYLRKRRIAYFAIAAVTMCTAMVLIVMSVMGGFLDQLKVKARGLLGDIIVQNLASEGFPLYDEFIADVLQWKDEAGRPLIAKATPVVYSYGGLKIHGATSLVRVVGIRLQDVYEVNAFKQSLYYEKYYPGTTELGEQQQPAIALDPNQTLVIKKSDGSEFRCDRPVLPEPYQSALERSYAAGIRDTETFYGPEEMPSLLSGAKLPPIVGVYTLDFDAKTPTLVGDKLPGLIIGRDLVAERMSDGKYRRNSAYALARGDQVALGLWSSAEGDPPLQPAFRYVDDSRTGIYEIDSKYVYCDFALLQKMIGMDPAPRTKRTGEDTFETVGTKPPRCSQTQIKVSPGVNPWALARRLQDYCRGLADDPRFAASLSPLERMLLQEVDAETWEESQKDMIGPVEKERQLVTVLFGIISLVAAVLVLCILYMIVLQKTRDIGIVKSIGGSSAGVAAIFVGYGLAVGVVGSAMGVVVGYYFVRYINEFQDRLTRLNPAWQVWDRSVYSFDAIPNTVRAEDIVAVFLVAIIMSVLGSLAAAWRAGAMEPVEALRHE